MNAPIEPLEPDVVDELWSADLDGEFDAAAADLGLSPDSARARLAATPGATRGGRRSNRPRDALAARRSRRCRPTRAKECSPPRRTAHAGTDELARRRSRRPSSGRLAGFAVAAAAILLVVGIAVSIATTGSDHERRFERRRDVADTATSAATGSGRVDARVSRPTPPAAGAAAPVPVHDFGVVGDDRHAADARVGEALGLDSARDERRRRRGRPPASPTAAGVTAACLARRPTASASPGRRPCAGRSTTRARPPKCSCSRRAKTRWRSRSRRVIAACSSRLRAP